MVYSVSSAIFVTFMLGYLNTSHENLRMTLIVTSGVGYISGAIIFYIISVFYPTDLERDRDTEYKSIIELKNSN